MNKFTKPSTEKIKIYLQSERAVLPNWELAPKFLVLDCYPQDLTNTDIQHIFWRNRKTIIYGERAMGSILTDE